MKRLRRGVRGVTSWLLVGVSTIVREDRRREGLRRLAVGEPMGDARWSEHMTKFATRTVHFDRNRV